MARAKRCTGCGEEKPLEEFHRRSDGVLGRASRCKACRNPLNRALMRRRREEQPQKVADEKARCRARRPEVARTYERETVEGNLTRSIAGVCRKRGASYVERVSPLAVLEIHDGVCGICGEDVDPLGFDIDHVVPIEHGGFHNYENTQPAHPTCNRKKGSTYAEAA